MDFSCFLFYSSIGSKYMAQAENTCNYPGCSRTAELVKLPNGNIRSSEFCSECFGKPLPESLFDSKALGAFAKLGQLIRRKVALD